MRSFAAALLLIVLASPAVIADDKPPAPDIDHPLPVCSQMYPWRTPCATRPVAVWDPPPEYSKEARKKKVQGTVVLMIVIDTEGKVAKAQVVRPLGSGLDEKALEAARLWKFKPGTNGGKPVPVQVSVEMNFRLQ